MMSDATHVYIGSMPCGCKVAACVDSPGPVYKKQCAKAVSDMIKNGYSVERRPIEELRNGTIKLSRCVHKDKS